MKTEAIILTLVMVLSLTLAGVSTAHPGHGEPIEVPSEPAEPTEPDTGTTDTSTSDTTTTTSSSTTSTGSGSTGTASAPTETATSSSADTVTENAGDVDIYPGDSEDINSSWPIAALFGVAAVIGAVGVYYKGERLGL